MKTSTPAYCFAMGICTMLALEGCSTGHPTPSAKPTITTHVDSTAPEARVSTWAPEVSAGTWHYLIRDSSVISINNDTTARVEPIESTTIYTMSVADSDNSLLFTGHVDSLLINRPCLEIRARSSVDLLVSPADLLDKRLLTRSESTCPVKSSELSLSATDIV